MKALTTAASITRHGITALTEALLVVGIVSALAFGAAIATGRPAGAASVSAAGGGTSWIALNQVTTAAAVQPALGTSVSFSTGYPNNIKIPRIEVLCYQGGALVYGAAGSTTDWFLLGGGGSTWLSVGGAADCVANLFYFGMHAGQQTYNLLASTRFAAAG